MTTLAKSPATKDCRNCRRRRIRCDRGTPSCAKCNAKGILCPGYGLHLRWANSTTTEARSKAVDESFSYPTVCAQPSQGVDQSDYSASPLSPTSSQANSAEAALEALPETVLKRLLSHYATHIAPIMVWVDSERNEYKRLVVPLASAQSALKNALVAMASAHLCDEDITSSGISSVACRDAQHRITERVRKMIQGNSNSDDRFQDPPDSEDTDEAVLASALILSNHSLLTSQLSVAQIHRRAVRVLINSISFSGPSDGELFAFLRNQSAIFDIFTCTTMFDIEHITGAILPSEGQENVLFDHFLIVIHDITLESVRRQNSHPPAPATDVSAFEDRFELARSSTLAAAAALGVSCCNSMDIDFILLVQIYHHAGVLYAMKRLGSSNPVPEEDHHVRRLFRALENLNDLHRALHNLPWPIFIAGICSWPNIERIRTVQKISDFISEKIKFSHFKSVSSFHHDLWDSSHHDWLLVAKDWESRRIPVIPV